MNNSKLTFCLCGFTTLWHAFDTKYPIHGKRTLKRHAGNMINHKPNIGMIQLHKDTLLTMKESKNGSVMSVIWSEACGNLLDPQNSPALDRMNKILREKSPDKVLVDLKLCQFYLDPENLSWKDHFLSSMLTYKHASRVAFVVPSNLFVYPAFEATRISLEQQGGKVNYNYFDGYNQALTWLLEG